MRLPVSVCQLALPGAPSFVSMVQSCFILMTFKCLVTPLQSRASYRKSSPALGYIWSLVFQSEFPLTPVALGDQTM